MRAWKTLAAIAALNLTGSAAAAREPPAPLADHHVHIWSPNAARLVAQSAGVGAPPTDGNPITAEDVLADLDRAGVKRAAVLSVAYWFESPLMPIKGDRIAQVHAENDWVAAQVAAHARRLVGFCSFSPLADDAMAELDRCARDKRFTGIKLHFGNSAVDLKNPDQVARMRKVFAAIDAKRLPLIVHLLTGETYGATESRAFLTQLLPAAPHIPIQIAHLAGSGPGYGPDEALTVYIDAIKARDRRMRNVWFDMAGLVTEATPPAELDLVARRIREIGVKRVLFGSDSARGFNPPSDTAWRNFRRLPLTEAEFATIAGNLAPYMR